MIFEPVTPQNAENLRPYYIIVTTACASIPWA